MMSVLFEPYPIGKMEIRNRFVHSATYEAMAEDDGKVTEKLVTRYADLSKGEVGLIIPGHVYVHRFGIAHRKQTGIYSDEMIPGLKKITDAVHQYGGKIAFQLAHAGRQASARPDRMSPPRPNSPCADRPGVREE